MHLVAQLAGEPLGERPETVCVIFRAFVLPWAHRLDDAGIRALAKVLVRTRSPARVHDRIMAIFAFIVRRVVVPRQRSLGVGGSDLRTIRIQTTADAGHVRAILRDLPAAARGTGAHEVRDAAACMSSADHYPAAAMHSGEAILRAGLHKEAVGLITRTLAREGSP
jgi:hypothetical protein